MSTKKAHRKWDRLETHEVNIIAARVFCKAFLEMVSNHNGLLILFISAFLVVPK